MNRKYVQRVPSGRSGQGRAIHASALVGSGKCWVKYDMSVGCLWEVLSLPHLGLALGAVQLGAWAKLGTWQSSRGLCQEAERRIWGPWVMSTPQVNHLHCQGIQHEDIFCVLVL